MSRNIRRSSCQKFLILLLSCCLPAFAADSNYDFALRFFGAKDYVRALKYFDAAVDASPTNGEYHYWRGRCLANLKRAKEASAEYKVAYLLADDPKIKGYCKQALAQYKKLPPSAISEGEEKLAFAVQSLSQAGKAAAAAPRSSLAAPSLMPAATSTTKRQEYFAADMNPVKSGKFFKLSSKKLEWDLQMNKNFLQSMQSANANLDRLAAGTNWTLAPRILAQNSRLNFNRRPVSSGPPAPAHAAKTISQADYNDLVASDIVVIIDHSGSMGVVDCPSEDNDTLPAQSRLSWSVEELNNFSRLIIHALPHGFTLITYDDKPDVYSINSQSQLTSVLRNLKEGGGTNLAAALKEAFRTHNVHRQQPLLIAVITDAEIDLQSAQQTIAAATHEYPLPNGVFITLLQVGEGAEAQAADTLSLLNNLRSRAGAAYDPFIGIPFSRLRREGVGRDILAVFHAAVKDSKSGPSKKPL
ncbi:MAG: VWA domain-containing protein [Candidatus Obscuribacterales bacterium]|nr:VWA domain-containing protein [Candidatus Obscuribacterales bacterium]